MKKSELSNQIGVIVGKLQFLKRRTIWIREMEQVYLGLYLQKSQYGNIFYLNFGIFIKAFGVPEGDIHLWHASGRFGGNGINRALDFDHGRPFDWLELETLMTRKIKKLVNAFEGDSSIRNFKLDSEDGFLTRREFDEFFGLDVRDLSGGSVVSQRESTVDRRAKFKVSRARFKND